MIPASILRQQISLTPALGSIVDGMRRKVRSNALHRNAMTRREHACACYSVTAAAWPTVGEIQAGKSPADVDCSMASLPAGVMLWTLLSRSSDHAGSTRRTGIHCVMASPQAVFVFLKSSTCPDEGRKLSGHPT